MTAIDYCRRIALCTEQPGRITRTFLSPPMHDVHRLLGDWMRRIGMTVWVDAVGNLRGLYGEPTAPRLIIGSHLDSVPDAGAFDGVLGVVLGIALIEAAAPERLAIEVIGFSEEEGVRFGFPFIGSTAVVGALELDAPITDAIRAFGLDPERLGEARLSPQSIGYLEFHIEQGPVLDATNLSLGVVDAIVGQSRYLLTFQGSANHAGTTPMSLRRDALAAAAEWIACVEKYAASTDGLVATVGSMQVEPNAGNVIPGTVRASLDVRHACDAKRIAAVNSLLTTAHDICERRKLTLADEQRLNQAAVSMDPTLSQTLSEAVDAAGHPVHRMSSGAGHDAMIIAPHVPSTMLFLRSPGGISHHPDESVLQGDVEAAIATGVQFIRKLEAKYA